MRPDSATTIQRPDLGQLAWEYLQEEKTFIGRNIMPIFGVPEQSMDYPIIPIEAILKQRTNLKRASRAAYARADWEWTTGTFACAEYGWEEPIDDREAALYSRFFDIEAASTEIATGVLLRDHEVRVQTVLAASANSQAAAVAWSTPATATPKADVKTTSELMRSNFGIKPNAIAMGKAVWENLLVTQELRDYMQYTSPHLLLGQDAQRETVARYFGVDQVLVGDTQQDTAKRGKAATLADIWPNNEAYMLKVADGPNLRQPSVGRTFLWTADTPNEVTVETYREEKIRSTIVRVRGDMAEGVQYAGAIYKITGV